MKKRIGIIGCGNMGGAILAGLVKNRIVTSSRINVYDKILPKAKALSRQWKVRARTSNAEVVRASDIVVLAVKPQDLFAAASEFQRAFTRRHFLVTILAGTPIAKVRRAVGPKPKIVRAMPNLGAQVGEAITALAANDRQSLALAEILFSSCGKTVRLAEKHFDLITAVSGSGPAYFFYVIELLADFAEKNGLSKKDAQSLAIQTAVGAAKLAQSSEFSPAELRKMVTSKGGTTEAALKALEEKGFGAIFHEALAAALKRGRELSRK